MRFRPHEDAASLLRADEALSLQERDRSPHRRARCAEALGDSQTALQAYKDYLKDNPGSPLALKVTELEVKSSSPSVSK